MSHLTSQMLVFSDKIKIGDLIKAKNYNNGEVVKEFKGLVSFIEHSYLEMLYINTSVKAEIEKRLEEREDIVAEDLYNPETNSGWVIEIVG